MTAYFITATGTDIGKTYLTAGLVRFLRARGESAGAIKPVASGFAPETAAASDPGQLLTALGEAVSEENLARIAPWRFAAPLSPDMAAAREGRAIDYDALLAFCRQSAAAARGAFFVEGVGGVMVPLDARHTVLDWMAALGFPVVLVTGSYLGCISHTLTAEAVLAEAGLTLALRVVNDSGDGAVPLAETLEVLARFGRGAPMVALPRRRGPADPADFAAVWRALAPCAPS